MAFDAETVLERRRLRRRASFWRAAAIVVALIGLAALAGRSDGLATITGSREIARIKIHGLITENRAQLRLIEKAAKSKRVAAVLLDVNSPGGTTTGGEALFTALRRLAEKKPVVAVFGTMATSAAYMVGLASDRIVTHGNTVTGSVGVIFQWAEVHELLTKLGVKMNEVKSGALKANPSMFAPLDDAGRQVAEDIVLESQQWFLALVRKRRGIEPASVSGLEEGRIFSGRQAVALKLADEIGGEREAVAWLSKEKGIDDDLVIKTWHVEGEGAFGLPGFARSLARSLFAGAFQGLLTTLAGANGVAGLTLDGLVSVWHPVTN